ncbi:MAG: glycerol-3-phosphate 1-O-acyltransferase PlsY [Sandaracinaceae bacterium]|nr:glycerol-3-phosphate 1-O-acyltransferase PlsY [Sandaracinaceae bacterium]
MPLGPPIAVAAYLLGSISFAILIGRRHGVDLREEGSGNPGATNAGRVLGKRIGRWVLLLDFLKGAVPAGVGWALLGLDSPWTSAIAAAAVVGHCFPIWHGLRGGKGVATSGGVLLVLAPPAGLAALAGYVVGKKLTRRASVGSLLAGALGAAVAFAWLGPEPRSYLAAGLFGLILVRHVDNLRRLWRGDEPPS